MKQASTKQISVANLTELLKPYRSGWVALSADEREVIAAAETLRDTRAKAERRGVADPVFIKVISPDQGYLPTVL